MTFLDNNTVLLSVQNVVHLNTKNLYANEGLKKLMRGHDHKINPISHLQEKSKEKLNSDLIQKYMDDFI